MCLLDGCRFCDCLGGKHPILFVHVAEFHATDFDIWGRSREGKVPFWSQVNVRFAVV